MDIDYKRLLGILFSFFVFLFSLLSLSLSFGHAVMSYVAQSMMDGQSGFQGFASEANVRGYLIKFQPSFPWNLLNITIDFHP